ncbi:transcriptional activator FtrA [Sphingobacterium spiritivorum]|uniref:Transcriptional activator FtrA n=1 Tax=Sphingobacterium spiritivorum TaxID=258 RepID=A0A380BSQ5_SPHSI|nr:AraC family transcriptional regulator [Sphingobacterium spiritivorum]SUJ06282.1 transcriptional activator FtrA [Sphingobacterium spiritivorum]
MLNVKCSFSVKTKWKEELASKLNGRINGNYIEIPDEIFTGSNYVLSVDKDFSIWFSHGKYHKSICFQSSEYEKPDFFCIIFGYGTKNMVVFNETRKLEWNYGFAVLDSTDKNHFIIEAGTENRLLAIFVKKEALHKLTGTQAILYPAYKNNTDPLKNIQSTFGRANPHAWKVLNDFRYLSPASVSFDYFLIGAMYSILGIFIDEISNKANSSDALQDTDVRRILITQEHIIRQLDKNFPGIQMLASIAYMSESKFKYLFRKITGLSPNSFFIKNKLELTRKIIELESSTIAEIAKRMNYSSHSYLSEQFKKHFGLLPKEYRSNLFPHYPHSGDETTS